MKIKSSFSFVGSRFDGGHSRLCALAAISFLWLGVGPARAEYHLHPGDVLEFSVAGVQDLRQRVTVNLDGDVALPLIGTIHVAGSGLSDVRSRVLELLPSKLLRQRTADGKETFVAIGPDEVTLNIAEYRPVYVVGDVAKPGEQPYRPGMTVRQAIALAGGTDISRLRIANPFLEAADARGEYDALWTEFAKQQANQIRIKAELDNASELDMHPLDKVPIPHDTLAELKRLQTERLGADQNDLQKELDHLQTMIGEAKDQHDYLTEQHKQIQMAIAQQNGDVDRVRDLYSKGLAPLVRVTDEQRTLWFSSERLLQTAAEAAQVQRNREELIRQREKAADHSRMDLLKELEDSTVKLSAIRAKLSATAEKLVYAGAARAQLGNDIDIRIYKAGSSGSASTDASPDLEAEPGAVIEVTLRRDADIKAAAQ